MTDASSPSSCSSLTTTTTTAANGLPLSIIDSLEHAVSDSDIQAVLDSWKYCYSHTHSFEEEFGKLLLIRLFQLEPRTKLLFGFHKNSDPTATELGEMALIMRAVRLTRNLNGVFQMLEHDRNALKQFLLTCSHQRKDFLIRKRDIPLMGQALMHAMSSIVATQMGSSNINSEKSVVWNHDLVAAWQQVIDAIAFQVIGAGKSSSSTTSSTSTRTSTSGDKSHRSKHHHTTRSCLESLPSMPLRQPLRKLSQPQQQSPPQALYSSSAIETRAMATRRAPPSQSLPYNISTKKTSRRHRRRRAKSRVLITKTTTTTTTYHTTTTTANMSNSSDVTPAITMDYAANDSDDDSYNYHLNGFNDKSNGKMSAASFKAMNYTTTSTDSPSCHHKSSSIHASMGNYTSNNCSYHSTSSSTCQKYRRDFRPIPQAYAIAMPSESEDGSSSPSFGAIQAMPETLLRGTLAYYQKKMNTGSSKNNINTSRRHHLHHPSQSFNNGSSSRARFLGIMKQLPVRAASARKLYIAS